MGEICATPTPTLPRNKRGEYDRLAMGAQPRPRGALRPRESTQEHKLDSRHVREMLQGFLGPHKRKFIQRDAAVPRKSPWSSCLHKPPRVLAP